MKFLGFILISNRRGKYAIVDINARLREIYLRGKNEAVYSAYRAIMNVDTEESYKVVRPLIREWEGKK